jgi:hypothetical protein
MTTVRMCEEKQAIYINQLSYKVFKLKFGKDIREVITIDQAKQFTYEMAQDTIGKLERQVEYYEYRRFTKSKLKRDAEMRDFYRVQFIENYKTIKNVKVDLNENKAYLLTDTGEEIVIEGKIKSGDWYDNYGTLYKTVKTAIDGGKKLNIFKCDEHTMVFLEPEEEVKEKNRLLVGYMNKIMDISDNKLPALKDQKGTPDVETFKRILFLIQMRNIKLYEELNTFMENRNNAQDLVDILNYGKMQTQGYVTSNNKIDLNIK